MITSVNDTIKSKKNAILSPQIQLAGLIDGRDVSFNTRFLHENKDDLKAFWISVTLFYGVKGKKMSTVLDRKVYAD